MPCVATLRTRLDAQRQMPAERAKPSTFDEVVPAFFFPIHSHWWSDLDKTHNADE